MNPDKYSYKLGFDIGGTFTDFVIYEPNDNKFTAWKVLSTKEDPVKGILNGIKQIKIYFREVLETNLYYLLHYLQHHKVYIGHYIHFHQLK